MPYSQPGSPKTMNGGTNTRVARSADKILLLYFANIDTQLHSQEPAQARSECRLVRGGRFLWWVSEHQFSSDDTEHRAHNLPLREPTKMYNRFTVMDQNLNNNLKPNHYFIWQFFTLISLLSRISDITVPTTYSLSLTYAQNSWALVLVRNQRILNENMREWRGNFNRKHSPWRGCIHAYTQ